MREGYSILGIYTMRKRKKREEEEEEEERRGSDNPLGAKIDGAGATVPPQQLRLQLLRWRRR